MKKYAPWIAAVVALIAILALLLIPKLSGEDKTATVETATEVTATPEATATPETTEAPVVTEEPAATDVPEATGEATQDPADETAQPEATDEPAADALTAETVMASVNGREVSYGTVDTIAQNLMYSYSQYYDVSDEAMQQVIYEMAMDYAIQLELMDQKATEWGFDQMSDEERAQLEADVAEEWENLIDTYIRYYGNLAEDATDEEKAAARISAVAGLEAMGYTQESMLQNELDNAKFDKVEAEMVKGVEITDEDVQNAFDKKVQEDKETYGEDIGAYEYMTQYYGQTSYYQPEGYRGVTHILLQVDDELLTAYQDLSAKLEEQQEAEEEAAAEETAEPAGEEGAAEETAEPAERVTREDVDAARDAIIASVQPTIDEINAKLAEGVPFADLVAEYGTDPGMQTEPNKTEGYPVHLDSILWDPVFVQAAFSVENVGDIAQPVVGSYGVHIVQYTRDVPAGPVALTDEIKAELREQLLATAENELFNATMDAWMAAADVTYTAEGEAFVPQDTDTAE